MAADRVRRFLQVVTEWACARPDVRALALVGSHARGSARPDSDVDLVLVSSRPGEYLARLDWIARFGSPSSYRIEDYGKVTSVRVWYGDGLEVEFGITGEDWIAFPIDEGTQQVIAGGLVVLFEQGDLLSRHRPASPRGSLRPRAR